MTTHTFATHPSGTSKQDFSQSRPNLEARIIEATQEGWHGEVEGLQVGLAGARDKLAQLDAEQTRKKTVVNLGLPSFSQIAARTNDAPAAGS